MINLPAISLTQTSGDPRPHLDPEPGFDVDFRYVLAGGADVVTIVFCHPVADVLLGNTLFERCPVEVIDIPHTWATQGQSPVHIPITFRVPLPFSLVERIQEARAKSGPDKDVVFDIHPHLGMSRAETVSVRDQQGEKQLLLTSLTQPIYENQLVRTPVRLPRDRWLKLVDDLRYTMTLVVELPLHGKTSANIHSAQGHLESARSAFAHGNLDDVGARAFKAFEALVPTRGKKPVFTAIKEGYFNNADPTVAQAALDMLVALSKLYHVGGRHHASGAPVARHHARFLVGAAEMVVAWCAEASTK
jgi:hypothetical protein